MTQKDGNYIEEDSNYQQIKEETSFVQQKTSVFV